jgi:hypothetical protein
VETVSAASFTDDMAAITSRIEHSAPRPGLLHRPPATHQSGEDSCHEAIWGRFVPRPDMDLPQKGGWHGSSPDVQHGAPSPRSWRGTIPPRAACNGRSAGAQPGGRDRIATVQVASTSMPVAPERAAITTSSTVTEVQYAACCRDGAPCPTPRVLECSADGRRARPRSAVPYARDREHHWGHLDTNALQIDSESLGLSASSVRSATYCDRSG